MIPVEDIRAECQRVLVEQDRGNVDADEDRRDLAIFALYHTLSGSEKAVLYQLIRAAGPIQAGDCVIGPPNALVKLGLVTRVVVASVSGYYAATPLGLEVWKSANNFGA